VSPELTVRLVRHGQSRWNRDGRLQGQTARIPLTALGREQARSVAEALVGCGAVAVYSSDLRRAADTARLISRRIGVPVRLEPDLREQALGTLEGRRFADIWGRPDSPGGTDPDWRAPGGESEAEVYARLRRLFARLRNDHPGASVIMVTHGDTGRIALGLLRGHPVSRIPQTVLGNGEVVTVEMDRAFRPASDPPTDSVAAGWRR